jgi:hypothetical protein
MSAFLGRDLSLEIVDERAGLRHAQFLGTADAVLLAQDDTQVNPALSADGPERNVAVKRKPRSSSRLCLC